MNIAVCVKQVPDTETRIRIRDDKKGIEESDINFILNPYDEFAVEEGLRIKEKHGGEVTILSMGPDRVSGSIRSALAMGADKAVHLVCGRHADDPLRTATRLAEVLRETTYDIILLGKQAIDDDNAQVAPMLAELLELPAVTVVTALEISGEKVVATRQIEGGAEIVHCSLPAIISAQRGLNEPRYASLKGIMAAKKIDIEKRETTSEDDRIEVLEIQYPPQKPPGKIVGEGAEAVPELIRLLREEAKVI